MESPIRRAPPKLLRISESSRAVIDDSRNPCNALPQMMCPCLNESFLPLLRDDMAPSSFCAKDSAQDQGNLSKVGKLIEAECRANLRNIWKKGVPGASCSTSASGDVERLLQIHSTEIYRRNSFRSEYTSGESGSRLHSAHITVGDVPTLVCSESHLAWMMRRL